METVHSYRPWRLLSIVCFFMGVLTWLPNFIFDYGYGFWLLTFIVNPVGIAFGVLGKSKFGVVSNALMTFSFFLLMFFGNLIFALFSG
ncbi:hypothetical protein EQV77_06140 [Halobacillus fulvus]|nr:hypothetical protein EQV77_06140 [Halobacillus fulvus]